MTKVVADTDENGEENGHYSYKPTHVVEQRVSNLVQGLLTLGTMSSPLLVVLHLIPQAVLAGLFFIMGYQALEGNGITVKILFLLRDKSLTPSNHPLKKIRRRAAIWWFVALELVGFGATFAITQTIAAIGFPVLIMVLIPVRALLLPKIFSREELGLLDAPTASPFTLESVGGSYGHQDEGITEPGGSATPHGVGDNDAARDNDGSILGGRIEHNVAEMGQSRGIVSGEKGNDIEMGRVGISGSGMSRRSQIGVDKA